MTQTQTREIDFTRINNDTNGNPRYVCHFSVFTTPNERGYCYAGEEFDPNTPVLNLDVSAQYNAAIKKANKIGGKKFHNKQYGGGIVFQSYNIKDTERRIFELLQTGK
jgi:hypothetical protein